METHIVLTDIDFDGLGHNIDCYISVSGGDIPLTEMVDIVNQQVAVKKKEKGFYETGQIITLIVGLFKQHGFEVKDCTPNVSIKF